jgi:hypothetical protein
MRWLVLPLLVVVGCKPKTEEPVVEPVGSGPPPSGHSVTKVGEEGSGNVGSGKTASGSSTTSANAGAVDAGTVDAALYGGNGKPAYRDAQGHIRGPGGPVYMGTGPDCTDALDHCLREGVWFAVGKIRPGALFRAQPAFEFEGKWYDWRANEIDCEELVKTRLAKPADIVSGEPIIWLLQESLSQGKWLNSETDALTSSRWEAGYVGEVVSSEKFRVMGWDNVVPTDTARAIVDRKKCPNAS